MHAIAQPLVVPLHRIVVHGLLLGLLAVSAHTRHTVFVYLRYEDCHVAVGCERAIGECDEDEVAVDVW